MSLLGGLFGQKKSEGGAQGKAASTAPDLKALKESINRMENVLVRLQKAPLADVKNIERDILAYQRELASYMAALPTNHKAWVYLKGASGQLNEVVKLLSQGNPDLKALRDRLGTTVSRLQYAFQRL